MFTVLTLIFFNQLAVQVIEYINMKTITITQIDRRNADWPMVTFLFEHYYPTLFHQLYKYQFNRSLIFSDDTLTRPIEREDNEINMIFNRSNQV